MWAHDFDLHLTFDLDIGVNTKFGGCIILRIARIRVLLVLIYARRCACIFSILFKEMDVIYKFVNKFFKYCFSHRKPPKFPKKLTAENVKLVHPDFERYLKWR